MSLRTFSLSIFPVSILLVSSCAGAQVKPREHPLEAPPPEVLTFHAEVPWVPSDAQRVVLDVRWPADDGKLRLVGATGLVGNALCELPLQDDTPPGDAHEARFEHAILCSRPVEANGELRELVVETHGKPIELAFRIARSAGGSLSAAELEDALAASTTASADGRPLASATRRVR